MPMPMPMPMPLLDDHDQQEAVVLLSKKVTCNSHGEGSSYFLGWKEYQKNPYDLALNPNGIIQMGLAENQLSFDLVETWLCKHPEAADLLQHHNKLSSFRHMALFQDYHGLPAFKKALAEFMSEIRGYMANFDPNKMVLTAGATCANETLIFCLAEPGQAFLLPTPYYPGFDRDLKWRTGVEIIPIHCHSSNGFQITESALKQAYNEGMRKKLKVKGILITNPSNPLGITMSLQTLKSLLRFVKDKRIHLICDEIYSGTVFSLPEFVSLADKAMLDVGDDQISAMDTGLVHIVYSLSKDLGLPGFRVGAIYSHNTHVIESATKMSSFGLVSSQTQFLLAALLSDKKFTGEYLRENRKRLKRRQEQLVSGLRRCGITCLKSNSGLFCWADMRHLLGSASFEGEMELWKKMLYKVGLNISAGSSFHCCEPGWFRICFANMSENMLQLSLQRIKEFINSNFIFRLKGMKLLCDMKHDENFPVRTIS